MSGIFDPITLMSSVSAVSNVKIKHGRPCFTTRGELKIQRAGA